MLIISVNVYIITVYTIIFTFTVCMYKRKWTDSDLSGAVRTSYSIRQVIASLGLVPAGGNYQHVKRIISELNLDCSHFLGKGWASGMKFRFRPKKQLNEVLVANSHYQTHLLKQRLFDEKLKKPECEICGWSQKSVDGRIPVELDHINGDHLDNRLDNLRILCPNCHSLQTTHRGVNKVKYRSSTSRGGETG